MKHITYISQTDTEADTCRVFVTPKIKESKWTDDQIMEQREFTDGKIEVIGRNAKRKKKKKADYILRYATNFYIAVVEAKNKYKKASDGLQQAKKYAEMLKLYFAYATNGKEIIEYDFITGKETIIEKFPTPDELWSRFNNKEKLNEKTIDFLLKPLYVNPDKPIRYYQQIAINKAVQNILEGKKRVLLTLATGTGKTAIAFQIIYKLWENRWNKKNTNRKPKILFISDRTVLVQDPYSKDFAPCADARCILPIDELTTSRDIYFATYQSLARDENRPGRYREFDKDFFDLIVVDECHRGSASDESNWREILDYFSSAVQLGMTATPLREDNKDSYEYFGNPIYTYSLKQGREDGFLAPYVVHRVVPDIDATGFRPQAGQTDKYGQVIPDAIYDTSDFENTLIYRPRTRAVAKHLVDCMIKNGRMDKTIVFCVSQDHAEDMRADLVEFSKEMMKENANYIVRIVSEEGDIGKGHLSNFMDIDQDYPVIVTTSKLLSTGVDVPTCKNIVIFRMVNSMTEFKQIMGRGTRVREDKNKLFFTILDYTGSATRNFADPDFDGYPPLITSEHINEEGNTIEGTFVTESESGEVEQGEDVINGGESSVDNEEESTYRKYYVDEGTVTIVAETVQVLDEYGKLKTFSYSQYIKDKITQMFSTPDELRNKWTDIKQRQIILEELERNGITLIELQEISKQPDADPFDVLCFVAFNLKPKTRRERAELMKKNKKDVFAEYSEKARMILDLVLQKYIDYGAGQLDDSTILKLPPISDYGTLGDIANEFGGYEKLKQALDTIKQQLYAA